MLIVSHSITIGSTAYTSAAHSRLITLRTNASLGTPVNSASITLAPPDDISVTPGDDVVVELGYDDSLSTVFTGLVESVDWAVEDVTIRAAGAFRGLISARFNSFFEKSKAGDIVSNVAGLLEVSTGNVESGLELPAFALSNGLNAYDALRGLAERCGFVFYADADDKLVFAKYDPAETHPFQFGVNIVTLRVEGSAEAVTGTEIYGESPSSLGQGQEAYSWLTKKDVKGSAGASGAMTVQRFDPAIRTQEDAGKIAEAALALLRAKRTCNVKTLGAPEVHLGDEIEISDMPLSDQNGTFKVTGVSHRLDVKKGFFTIIDGIEA
jgi:prophage tail gpP-like protein